MGETLLKVLKIALCVAGGVVAYVLLLVILGFLSGLLTGWKKEYFKDSKIYRFILNSMTGLVIFLAGIRLKTEGQELPEGRFVIVGNHRSNWDPIVTWFKFRKHNISYISKPSNLKIPFYGRIVRRCCFLSIDRQNPRSSLKTIDKAADLITSDAVSIGVYPEGTRSKTCKLLRFHNGVFKIAQKANVPIVVVCVTGTEKVHKNYLRRHTDVKIRVLDVIPADKVANMSTSELGEEVKNKIAEALIEEGEQPFDEEKGAA
ncbi:MAG: 1-acyl-sn-glycerol-3-phosphate acyltransferase [Clostridia bacterium]|nr:1-acyl-sn-glycerol-3-phosphate acyltransferase [Clostridia bacterium]